MATSTNDSILSSFKPLNKTNERQATPAPTNQVIDLELEKKDTIGYFEDDRTPECIDANAGGQIPFSSMQILEVFTPPSADKIATEVFTQADKFVSLVSTNTKDIFSSVVDLVADEIVFTSPEKAREEAKMHQVYKAEKDKPKSEQSAPAYNPASFIESAKSDKSYDLSLYQMGADQAMGITGRQVTQVDVEKNYNNRSYALEHILNAAGGMAVFQKDNEEAIIIEETEEANDKVDLDAQSREQIRWGENQKGNAPG